MKKLGQAPRSYAKSLQNTDIRAEPVPFFTASELDSNAGATKKQLVPASETVGAFGLNPRSGPPELCCVQLPCSRNLKANAESPPAFPPLSPVPLQVVLMGLRIPTEPPLVGLVIEMRYALQVTYVFGRCLRSR